MEYKNARNVLPEELIQKIQEYVQGEYLYIPVKDRLPFRLTACYRNELDRRDAHIYTKYLEGLDVAGLAGMYHLSEPSIRRIIRKQREDGQEMKDRIEKVLKCWDLQNQPIRQVYPTAWQIGGYFSFRKAAGKQHCPNSGCGGPCQNHGNRNCQAASCPAWVREKGIRL